MFRIIDDIRRLKPDLFIEEKESIVTISAASFALWIKIDPLFEREMYDDRTSSSFQLHGVFLEKGKSEKQGDER